MRKKQATKVNKLRILMKSLMYLKNDFVPKESFSRENFPNGASTIFIESRSKIFIEGGKHYCLRHFFRGMLTVS